MSVVEEKITFDYESIITNSADMIHVLSDDCLAAIVLKLNGSTWDFEIYWSEDRGRNWTLKLTPITGTTGTLQWSCIGDKLYALSCEGVYNVALKFYRIDYDADTQTVSLAVNGATVRSAAANNSFSHGTCDAEAGGRVWAAYGRYVNGSWEYVEASYSDDGGASWTQSTGLSQDGTYPQTNIQISCLEGRTIVVYNMSISSSQYISYRTRLHTDSPNTWGANVNEYALSGAAAQPFVISTKCTATPPKRVYAVAREAGASEPRHWWIEIIEGADPYDLTINHRPSSGSWTGPAGESEWLQLIGLEDGFTIIYANSGSATTMRRRQIGDGATAWPSETTWAEAWLAGYSTWAATRHLNYPIADSPYLLVGYEGSGSSRRVWSMLQNVTGPCAVIQDLLVDTLASASLAHDLLIDTLATALRIADLLIDTLATATITEELAVEWMGLWLAIADTFAILVAHSEIFVDIFTISAQPFQTFQDSFMIKENFAGAEFIDSFIILSEKLVPLFNEDMQLPFAEVTLED